MRERLLTRNAVSAAFFQKQARPLAEMCAEMADRFLRGGRLIAFGRGAYATDAQHVSVEFIHPVIVGKRALPALDASPLFPEGVEALFRPDDMVMGFAPAEGDPEIERTLAEAKRIGALTFALQGASGAHADYAVRLEGVHPFIAQEIIEILYHTLWETVHVFFEHHALEGSEIDAGDAAFLYPFLGGEGHSGRAFAGGFDRDADAAAGRFAAATGGRASEKGEDGGRGHREAVVEAVARSIVMKAQDDEALRLRMVEEVPAVVEAIRALKKARERGGKALIFGNGGSATDANDWAYDLNVPPSGMRPYPAVSLAAEPAVLSALANDVGSEVIFLRQVIAHARPGDVAVAISTSGGSKNILLALEEARKRGLVTIALLGYDGGEVVRRSLADIPIIVRSDYIPRIQEVQASVYHIIREGLEVRSSYK
ncbi:MAG: Phosphoheptose isomerase 1 [Hydrogenibacillus schlegelii]|uniref:Phosphoheptose isomerase 1 n=1 Tax=Hydrogenibacillus schlegelii TaxID=1484 RepID=A0A2T5GCC2_HYDSH|nr:MAG: Phosphoheptose isomerase 1 [Hydrogenibacillus schlegelii]